MSSGEEKELKAGHAPAVKVGGDHGKRVPQSRHLSSGDKNEKTSPDPEFPEEESPNLHNQQILISGAMTKGDKDFTAEAVRQMHDKPSPAKDKRPINNLTHKIQQPR